MLNIKAVVLDHYNCRILSYEHDCLFVCIIILTQCTLSNLYMLTGKKKLLILAINDGCINNDVNFHGFLCEGSMESRYDSYGCMFHEFQNYPHTLASY